MKVENSQRRMELLSTSTGAEKATCAILDRLSIRYIKQYPIHTGRKTYFADIFIPTLRLILEIDGAYHYTSKQTRLDANRSAGIRRLGYHICRLSNHDARNPEKVKAKLRRYYGDKTQG